MASPATSHDDEVTLAELIAQLNALLVQLNAYLQANTTATVPTTLPTPNPTLPTPPTNTTSSGPTISVDGDSATGSIGIYDYGMWNEVSTTGGRNVLTTSITSRHDEFNYENPERDFPTLYNYGTVTYRNDDGFHGFYKHSNGNSGTIVSDVQLSLDIGLYDDSISDFRVGVRNPIVIEGQNLGAIDGLGTYGFDNQLTSDGDFSDDTTYYAFENVFYSRGLIYGAFSDQFTLGGNPERVAGNVKVWWTDNSWRAADRDENSLVGVFVADVEE